MVLRKTSKFLVILAFITALYGLSELFFVTGFGSASTSLAIMEGKGQLLELAHTVFCIDNLNTVPQLDSFIFWRLVIGYLILLVFSGVRMSFWAAGLLD